MYCPIKHAIVLICLMVATGSLYAQANREDENYTAYLAEIRATNSLLSNIPKGESILTKKGLAAARSAMQGEPLPNPPMIKLIPGPAGKISIRIFKPDTIRSVILSFHGGGWSAGTAASDDPSNDYLAINCRAAVVSVDYRLAPEHPFPACIEDCKAAARWVVNNASKEFGTDKIFISGASAGAHLSAVIALYIRDSLHSIDKVKGLNLIYGCYDLSRSPSNRMVTDSSLMLPKAYLDDVFRLVFPGWKKEKLQDPRYSPLYADLKNLPPALFTVGTLDPLVDDSFFLAARWRMAGNATTLSVYPECPHSFTYLPTAIAALANKKMAEWLRARSD